LAFDFIHYQKIDKYKRKYQGNISVGKFLRDFTDRNIPRYIPRELPWEKKLKQSKKNDDVSFLPTELPTDFSIPSVFSKELQNYSLSNCTVNCYSLRTKSPTD
jgi:hypothetical protein